MNLTSLFKSLVSMTSWSHLQQLTSKNLNAARNLNRASQIGTRNNLCRTIHQNRQEWIDACCEAIKAINEAKTESWKDLLQDTMSNSDGPNMWKIIQGLNDTPDANSPNEAMSHDGQTITNIKPNVFINHYTGVSKLNMSHSDCEINLQFKKAINAPSVDNEVVLIGELQSSIIKRWKVKEQLALTTFNLYFSSHLVLWSSRNYCPYSTHPFHLCTAHESGGCQNHSITESGEIS